MAQQVSVVINHIDDTKGTYKYLEDGLRDQYDQSGKIGVLYVKKRTFPNGAPARLKIDLTPLE